jgi:hypothetical protein
VETVQHLVDRDETCPLEIPVRLLGQQGEIEQDCRSLLVWCMSAPSFRQNRTMI